MELELITLLIIQTIFISAFARFELETPLISKLVKWFIIDGITIGLYFLVGHWAVVFPILGLIPGTIYHFTWCKKNGINPLKATPMKKYYELRGWKLPQDMT
ncbi:MAG: hypothetical protein IPL12_03565 [Bacteroidetes bacterium]|nr:hypothetical protein [Bacteroidota bacterium]MBK8342477.1 hypothetical protein [Bacteroidota bacterium]